MTVYNPTDADKARSILTDFGIDPWRVPLGSITEEGYRQYDYGPSGGLDHRTPLIPWPEGFPVSTFLVAYRFGWPEYTR